MRPALERLFGLAAAGSSVRVEVLAGTTTFLTLSYILFVQPAVMAAAGIPYATALFATCVASAFACLSMGLLANYPIALAPGMGHNFFFAFTVCAPLTAGGLGLTWQQGLAAVVLSGTCMIGLSAVRLREHVVCAIPDSLKHAIAAGIGLLIAMLGLQWSGVVVDGPALVQLGSLGSPQALLALFGIGITAALVARGVTGALLIGMAATIAVGMATGLVPVPERMLAFERPPIALTQLDFAGLFASAGFLEVLAILFFLDLFDTVGTLVGVGARAGLLRDGQLPRAGRAFLADASGTVLGAALGTSTITSYVESAAGVQAGGRTGLTAIVTGGLFLLALPLHPLIAAVGEGLGQGGGTVHPVLAPPLLIVGALMAKSAASIDWEDRVLALPSFLAMIVMPLTLSITDGIAFGFIGASLLSLVTGQPGRLHPLGHVFALAFVGRYALL